ncbi:AMP-binding domain containing protein [Asbolus verrucosus]|uniref:AMP-binding domain containing protein n=1 Tax=Asbolus verrucosus TaxID=1661398 RepID=A0A482VDA5_ASBVE|nr:AMP-binding domain containing protein [Asbolus verrucosus]
MSAKILEGPKLKSTVPAKSLGQLFFECAEKYSDRICQVDGTVNQSETYASVKLRSTRVAIELQKRGITSNDVVSFCSRNTLDSAIPILATFYLGAKVANLEPTLSVKCTRHMISLILPKIIFTEESAIGLIEESLETIDSEVEIIVYGRSTKYTNLSELITRKDHEDSFIPAKVDLHDVAIVEAPDHQKLFLIPTIPSCTLLLRYTMFVLIYSHMVGGYRVFCHSVEPENIIEAIEKYKVESILMSPHLVTQLTSFKRNRDYDISSLHLIICGGCPLTPSQSQKLIELFKNSIIVPVYGMTEVGIVSQFHPDIDKEFLRTKTESCGKPTFAIKLKVVDEDTNLILGPNQKGEIRVQTPCALKGFYNADSSQIFDEDGFFKTGDVGYYDEDGCLYFVERIKEMFKYRALPIMPSFIEAILLEHPAVKEAVVFGVPSGDEGDAPGAYIVLIKNFNVTKEEIFEFVAKRVSEREKLKGGITFVSSLPRTPTGKLMRKECRNLVLKSLRQFNTE